MRGLLDSTTYSPGIKAIGLRDTLDIVTQNGFAQLRMFAGQYKLIVQESDTVYGMKLGLIDVKGNTQSLPVLVVDKINFTPLEKQVFEDMFIKGELGGNQGYLWEIQPKFYIDIRGLPDSKKHWATIAEQYIKNQFTAGLDGFLINPIVEIGTTPPAYATPGSYKLEFIQFSDGGITQASTAVTTNDSKGTIYYAMSIFDNRLEDSVFVAVLPHELFTGMNRAGRFSSSFGPYEGIRSVINLFSDVLSYRIFDLTPWDQKSWKALKYLGPGQKKGFEQRDFSNEITIGPSRTYSVDELIQAGVHPKLIQNYIDQQTNRDLSRFETKNPLDNLRTVGANEFNLEEDSVRSTLSSTKTQLPYALSNLKPIGAKDLYPTSDS